jgi:hypothetical protein
MFEKTKLKIAVMCMWVGSSMANAQEPPGSSDELQLSQELQTLLRAEMREIAGASQAIVSSFVAGDWQSIKRLSEQIRDSYVMQGNISDTQVQELQDKLPDHFKRLDADFHVRAERLALAALAEDPELVAFHYYRMLETCATCHAAFATSRFPGFSSESPKGHHH